MTNEQGAEGSRRSVDHVVFDWNGTLIDDCELAVETVNTLRVERGMPRITRAHYRRAFRFPISAFYRDMGFAVDAGAFSALMVQYLAHFNARVDRCPLHRGAIDSLERLRASGIGVHILSASHHGTLLRSLEARGLSAAFDRVSGLRDSLASDKVALGQRLSSDLGAAPDRVLYVGDTDHDHEVAVALGWRFLFVDHGHQAAVAGAPHCARTLTSLDQILSHVNP
ncbi:MAG: HAD hydrolase-like protein [Polyangiaceae bacterium]